jgi:hypothetical protein
MKKQSARIILNWFLLAMTPSFTGIALGSDTTITVVNAAGKPISKAQIIIVQEGSPTEHSLETDKTGSARVELEEDDPVVIFCAHPEYLGWRRTKLRLKDRLRVKLKPSKDTGSIVIASSSGNLPGIEGTLTTVLDKKEKLLLKGENITIENQKKDQLTWRLKRPLQVVDTNDHRITFTIQSLVGSFVLIDFQTHPQKEEKKPTTFGTTFLVIDESGNPVTGASVVLVHARNNTHTKGVTGLAGKVSLTDFPNEPVFVYCAHKHYRAFKDALQRPYGAHTIKIRQENRIGSAIFPSRTGYLPGVKGRFNPHLDRLGRYYMYATNIALESGKQQPVTFVPGRPITAVDSSGVRCVLTVLEIRGDTSLIEFTIR